MGRSKKGLRNGRRKNALAYLENKLAEWKSHSNDYVHPRKGTTRSHEAEQARLEKEIETLKSRIR